MIPFLFQQCKPGRKRPGLHILSTFFLFFYVTSILQSQPVDSVIHLNAAVSGEYYDIFRQRTDRSTTIILARFLDAKFSVSKGSDTLSFAYSRWNQYASYNNFPSVVSLSAENMLRSFSLQWISSIGQLGYSCKILVPFSVPFLPLYYTAGIRFEPFGKIFATALTYERMPILFASGLGLKDFSFNLDEHSTSSTWNVMLRSQPIEFAECTFAYGKKITKTMGTAKDYSSPFYWSGQTFSAKLQFYPNKLSSFWIGLEKGKGEGEETLYKDNLEFGDLAYGELIFDRWHCSGKTTVFSLPVVCEYNYRRWEGYNVGHIESWPFTPLAATVFDNRLYYRVSGSIDIHQIESNISIEQERFYVEPSVGLLYIQSDIMLKHWEPEFLVFGVKNVEEMPFSIQRCWLMHLGCQLNVQIFGAGVQVQMEQYIPLSVKYYEKQESPAPPGPAATPSAPSSTDGGRRIRLQVSLP